MFGFCVHLATLESLSPFKNGICLCTVQVESHLSYLIVKALWKYPLIVPNIAVVAISIHALNFN